MLRSLANHANCSSCVEGRFWELSLVSRTTADASMAVSIGGQLLIDRMECAMRSVVGDVGGRFWELSLVSRTTADASMAVGIGGQLLIDRMECAMRSVVGDVGVVKYLVANEMPRVRFPDGAFSYATLLFYLFYCVGRIFRRIQCVVDIKFNALCYRSLANHANCSSCVEGRFWELSLVSRTTADASMAVGIGGQLLIDRMECAMRSVVGDVGVVNISLPVSLVMLVVRVEMPRVRFPDGAFSYATLLFYLFYCVGRIFRRIQCVVDIKFNALCYRSLANHANCSSCVEGRFWELSLVSRTTADASMAVGIGGQLLIDRMECAMRSVVGDVGVVKYLVANEMPRVRFPDGAFSYATLLFISFTVSDASSGVSSAW
ncbi:hypothetical protein GN244_ATG01943 [Phytophthora infestans]|uniref:Uncharacterized protein n=1 Tax=Phytophthora infestans TaxID=4787 RepID=A0A833WM47_PHYIN|nr:hypothetical protein GN244_ATG01943 [Phytophthora infestans]